MKPYRIKLIKPPSSFSITRVNLARAEDVLAITMSLRRYWPLTVRSVYYKVISSPVYAEPYWRSQKGRNKGGNLESPEDQISEILKYLRLVDGRLPLEAINDDSRIVTRKAGSADYEGFVAHYLNNLQIPHYSQCLAEEQENYIEVWVEKNGLVHIAETVADEFCRRVVGCKGFPSVTCLADYAERVRENTTRGQMPLILYFGDLDPAGWLIPKTTRASLRADHHLDVEILRYGLNPEDLKPGMVSINLEGKKPVKREFTRETGLTVGYELDLLDPGEFQDIVRGALWLHTDQEIMEIAREKGEENNEEIADLNGRIDKALEPIRAEWGI